MSGKLTLTIIAGAKQGEAFAFDEHDTLLFGRLNDCQICLPDDSFISRHPFLLEVNPPDARIRDLGSLHGTHINGQKYGGREKGETPAEGARRQHPQVDLRHGDEIKVGKTAFRVSIERPANALPEQVRCQRCGKDVSSEVKSQQGEYVCQACRQQVESDPGVLFMSLTKQVPHGTQARIQISERSLTVPWQTRRANATKMLARCMKPWRQRFSKPICCGSRQGYSCCWQDISKELLPNRA